MSYRSYDHTCNNTLARTCNVIDNVSISNAMRVLSDIMFILKAIKSHLKGSYDKLNLTLVVISNEMTTRVRSYIEQKALSIQLNPIFAQRSVLFLSVG